jgi:hypothetical protein
MEGAMECSEDECKNDDAVPFILFKKDLSTERRSFCPKHLNKFRRKHGNELRDGKLTMRVYYSLADTRSMMAEFSGQPARRRPRL